MELVCPAGNMPSLKNAIANGADAVYVGLKDETNARHFIGLNFNQNNIGDAVEYAHSHGRKIYLAINTYPQQQAWPKWKNAVDVAAEAGVDALIIADIGVLDYAANKANAPRLHLSVQGSATSQPALEFYKNHFNIQRAVLPRVLSLKQVQMLSESTSVELEVFAFGSLCIMAEGRCILSSYATGESPNTCGACSPAKFVRWEEIDSVLESRLNDIVIDRFEPGENAGYPTLCKGRFKVEDNTYHALEEPASLNTLELLPELKNTGISAIKIEGRQRSPAYIKQVANVFRQAIDGVNNGRFNIKPEWSKVLQDLSEGAQTTLGAYHRPWQ